MKTKLYKNIALILSLFAMGTFAFSMQLFVPVDDPVYDFLERQATRGYISEFMNDSRPLQRDEIAQWLSTMHGMQNELHRIDRALLNDYMGEYRRELTDQKHPDLADTNDYRLGFASWKNFKNDMSALVSDGTCKEEKHIYLMEDDENTVWINVDFMVRGEGKNKTLRFIDRLGAEAAMQIGDHLSLFADGYFFHHYLPDDWREPADEFKGYWLNDHEFEHLTSSP